MRNSVRNLQCEQPRDPGGSPAAAWVNAGGRGRTKGLLLGEEMSVAEEVFGIQHPHRSQHQHSARRVEGSRRLTTSRRNRAGCGGPQTEDKVSLAGRMISQLFKPWVSATVGLTGALENSQVMARRWVCGLWVVEGRTFASQDDIGNNGYSLSLGILLSHFKQQCVLSGETEGG